MSVTFEAFLRTHLNRGIIDFSVRARKKFNGRITFYIHPQGQDGDTFDYEVDGMNLRPDPDVQYQEQETAED